MKTQDSPRSSCNHPNKRRMWPQFLKRRQQKSSFMLPVTMSCADILQRFQVSCSRHNVCDPIIWKGKKYYRKIKSAYEEFQAETLLLYFIGVIHWIFFFHGCQKIMEFFPIEFEDDSIESRDCGLCCSIWIYIEWKIVQMLTLV